MRRPSSRDRAAASLYGVFAIAAVAAAILLPSAVLLAVAVICGVAAVAALRGFPFDVEW